MDDGLAFSSYVFRARAIVSCLGLFGDEHDVSNHTFTLTEWFTITGWAMVNSELEWLESRASHRIFSKLWPSRVLHIALKLELGRVMEVLSLTFLARLLTLLIKYHGIKIIQVIVIVSWGRLWCLGTLNDIRAEDCISRHLRLGNPLSVLLYRGIVLGQMWWPFLSTISSRSTLSFS